mmetsp:Transcript_33940/g.80683  ORF Transcript_33940/g.80683 Transcript_33940/m.80683 type:complete len:291 (+) Transcript_33940:580-1452(+)
MKGSVRLAESKSMLTHMPASLVAAVSRHAIRQPKVITLMTISSISVTTDLRCIMVCTLACISASASSVTVLRQSASEIKKGLIAKKATICSPTSTSASCPAFESQKLIRKRIIAKTVKPIEPPTCGLVSTSVCMKNIRSWLPSECMYSPPLATACSISSRSCSTPLSFTLERSMALTVIVESAIFVSAATWSLVTRRMLCFSRISSRRSMMYGTKSSVTPAKGSSSTMSRSDCELVRCRTSSKAIILRWPPDRPDTNSPAMVPPIFTSGLYDAFFAPPAPLSSFCEYRFQ